MNGHTDTNTHTNTNNMLHSKMDPNRMSEMFMNNLMINKFSDVLSNNFELTFANCLKFIILMCMVEIKSSVTSTVSSLLSFMTQHVKKFPLLTVCLYNKFANLRKPKLIAGERLTDLTQSNIIKMRTDDSFMFSLYKYICLSEKATFSDNIIGLNINNSKDRIKIQKIYNLCTKNIRILNTITFHVNTANQEAVKSIIFGNENNVASTEILNYRNLLTESQTNIVTVTYDALLQSYSRNNILANLKAKSDYVTEYDIAGHIVKKYPRLNVDEIAITIGIICAIHSTIDVMAVACKKMKTNNILIFDTKNRYDYKDITGSKKEGFYSNMIKGYNQGGLFALVPENAIAESFRHYLEGANAAGSKNETISSELEIEILNTDPNKVDAILKKFVSDVYKHGKKTTSNTNINYLALVTTKMTIQVPNPEYESWSEKMTIIKELCTGKDENKAKETEMMSFLTAKIPPKTIPEITITKKMTSKLLNVVSKDIDTLYLRKADKDKLMNSLTTFKDKKEVFRNLGLPNKLNILLYGLPGTGKSTAIQAIGTYLCRDIYYLDLKDAKTNEDLQKMFDFVNKNVSNGGIIVIEDIDAMIDIVRKRVDPLVESSRVSDLIASDKNALTLEYLLNILQGTLTVDDSMFIVTTNYIDHLDPAFYRDGRFDVKIELKLCDHHQIKTIYQKFMERVVPENLLARIEESKYSPASIIYHVKDYIYDKDMSDEEILEPFLV